MFFQGKSVRENMIFYKCANDLDDLEIIFISNPYKEGQMSRYCLFSDTRTQVWWWKAFISQIGLILLQIQILGNHKELCSIRGSCFLHLQVFPSKTHFSEPGCSQEESKCAHASLHMSSISSLSSLRLSHPLFISLSPWKWCVSPALYIDSEPDVVWHSPAPAAC